MTEFVDTIPTTPADLDSHGRPVNHAPRVPRQRHVDGYGLAGLLVLTTSAVAVLALIISLI
ncbi:MAG: hypothetical protein MUC86_13545 [Burkholderiaceae bacterium]|jgi:hypothetical protein|nr:hypothetical protein [Burkholderiaceae bacterium]